MTLLGNTLRWEGPEVTTTAVGPPLRVRRDVLGCFFRVTTTAHDTSSPGLGSHLVKQVRISLTTDFTTLGSIRSPSATAFLQFAEKGGGALQWVRLKVPVPFSPPGTAQRASWKVEQHKNGRVRYSQIWRAAV